MTDLRNNLRALARDALGASKKRRYIARFLKKRGFISLGQGDWLGFRNEDIVSGIMIDAPPFDTYITTYILPSFDRHKFITWELGDRVVERSNDRDTKEECEQAIAFYVENISKVRSSVDLLKYLDTRSDIGDYARWARYICYLKNENFGAAVEYLDDDKLSELHLTKLEKFEEINKFVVAGDMEGVRHVLNSWSKFSERIFGPFDQVFSAI